MVHVTKVCDPELVRIRTIDSSAEPKRYKQFNTGKESSDLDDALFGNPTDWFEVRGLIPRHFKK